MRIASLAILFNGPLSPRCSGAVAVRVRGYNLEVCFFFIIIIAGRYHTQSLLLFPSIRTPQPRQHFVVYGVPVYLCARSSSSSYSFTYCLSVCNSGPAPDGLTRFSYLLCTGRVARAVYRRRQSSLLSNGFAAAVVYTRHLLTHTSYRTAYYTHTTDFIRTTYIDNGFRKRFVRRDAREEKLTRAPPDRSRSTEIETLTVSCTGSPKPPRRCHRRQQGPADREVAGYSCRAPGRATMTCATCRPCTLNGICPPR